MLKNSTDLIFSSVPDMKAILLHINLISVYVIYIRTNNVFNVHSKTQSIRLSGS